MSATRCADHPPGIDHAPAIVGQQRARPAPGPRVVRLSVSMWDMSGHHRGSGPRRWQRALRGAVDRAKLSNFRSSPGRVGPLTNRRIRTGNVSGIAGPTWPAGKCPSARVSHMPFASARAELGASVRALADHFPVDADALADIERGGGTNLRSGRGSAARRRSTSTLVWFIEPQSRRFFAGPEGGGPLEIEGRAAQHGAKVNSASLRRHQKPGRARQNSRAHKEKITSSPK